MAIDYHNNDELMQIECDVCGHIDIYYGTFQECIQDARAKGWVIVKNGDDWAHYHNRSCKLKDDSQKENESCLTYSSKQNPGSFDPFEDPFG